MAREVSHRTPHTTSLGRGGGVRLPDSSPGQLWRAPIDVFDRPSTVFTQSGMLGALSHVALAAFCFYGCEQTIPADIVPFHDAGAMGAL